jgi:transcription elongation GreA/GreB family factor
MKENEMKENEIKEKLNELDEVKEHIFLRFLNLDAILKKVKNSNYKINKKRINDCEIRINEMVTIINKFDWMDEYKEWSRGL